MALILKSKNSLSDIDSLGYIAEQSLIMEVLWYVLYSYFIRTVFLSLAGMTFEVRLIENFCIYSLLRKHFDFQMLRLHLAKLIELNWEVT